MYVSLLEADWVRQKIRWWGRGNKVKP